MSPGLRQLVSEMVLNRVSGGKSCSATRLARVIACRPARRHLDPNTPQYAINDKVLSRELNVESSLVNERLQQTPNFRFENKELLIKVPVASFSERVIEDIITEGGMYGHGFDVHRFIKTKNGVYEREKPERVIVEYGSPNVAKPLHAGHLRSSIIGQFVGNINQVTGNSVLRLSYLGDWGTQFGLLATGFRKFGNDEHLRRYPIKHLEEVYIRVNAVVEEEGLDGLTYKEALKFMNRLEAGDSDATVLWRRFRDLSLESCRDVFQRLGISFDETEYESDYVDASDGLCDRLEKQGLLLYDDKNVGFIQAHKSKIILKKSDGTSLYLSRDLAAFLDRLNKYEFSRIHYVVDSGQSSHFQKMKQVLGIIGCEVANQENFHVSFGRLKGMSTRKGNAIHLNDVIDEAKQRMMSIMMEKSTTKAHDVDIAAENLALSAVFIQDLKEKRQKDYDFNWDRMLSNKGATGPFLQYGHARLSSIDEHFQHYLDRKYAPKYEMLCETEALRLTQHMARYDQILNEVYSTLEPHTLVHYLLDLVTLSNAALAKLNIKNSPEEVATTRFRLFHSCRLVLANGIKILGLKPLYKM